MTPQEAANAAVWAMEMAIAQKALDRNRRLIDETRDGIPSGSTSRGHTAPRRRAAYRRSAA
jgi:hypothetical protein